MRLRAASGHVYALLRRGQGKPLLLLHGFTGDGTTWRGITDSLSQDYELLALDLLGHGDSDAPASPQAYTMESAAVDIISLLEALQLERVNVLGYSMGGRLALYLALHYPQRFGSLILESAAPGIADKNERELRRQRDNNLAEDIERRGIAWFVKYWESLPLWESQRGLAAAVLDAQRAQRLRNSERGLAGSLRGMGAGAQASLWNALPQLQAPTLLAVGALDAKFRRLNAEMAESIPNARLAVIGGAGHNAHLENPAAFAAVVAAHLTAYPI